MHSNVTIKNVSWPHYSWPTLYTFGARSLCAGSTANLYVGNVYRLILRVRKLGGDLNQIWRADSPIIGAGPYETREKLLGLPLSPRKATTKLSGSYFSQAAIIKGVYLYACDVE